MLLINPITLVQTYYAAQDPYAEPLSTIESIFVLTHWTLTAYGFYRVAQKGYRMAKFVTSLFRPAPTPVPGTAKQAAPNPGRKRVLKQEMTTAPSESPPVYTPRPAAPASGGPPPLPSTPGPRARSTAVKTFKVPMDGSIHILGKDPQVIDSLSAIFTNASLQGNDLQG
jgi:hypothetical protein